MKKNVVFNKLLSLGFEPFKYKPKWGQTRWRVRYKCKECGVECESNFDKVLYRKFTGKCFWCSRVFKNTKEKNLRWRGGVTYNNGYAYIRVYKDDQMYEMSQRSGYVKRSRYNMAMKLGRPLSITEIVHHVNGDSGDDSLDNLELFGNTSEHSVREYLCRNIDKLGRLSRKEICP